jgi:hypothetical protein
MFPIFLVLTALVAANFYFKATEELPQILTLTVVAICLFLALTIAPWEVQLLTIVSVTIVTRKLCLPKPGRFG